MSPPTFFVSGLSLSTNLFAVFLIFNVIIDKNTTNHAIQIVSGFTVHVWIYSEGFHISNSVFPWNNLVIKFKYNVFCEIMKVKFNFHDYPFSHYWVMVICLHDYRDLICWIPIQTKLSLTWLLRLRFLDFEMKNSGLPLAK